MNLKVTAIAATALISVGFAGTAAADAVADGAKVYQAKACFSCHGQDAKTSIMPTYPVLAGQHAAYAAQQIKDIRDGKRTNAMAAVMKGIVAGMSDADVDAVAAYLESLPTK
jgi:cytochrome c